MVHVVLLIQSECFARVGNNDVMPTPAIVDSYVTPCDPSTSSIHQAVMMAQEYRKGWSLSRWMRRYAGEGWHRWHKSTQHDGYHISLCGCSCVQYSCSLHTLSCLVADRGSCVQYPCAGCHWCQLGWVVSTDCTLHCVDCGRGLRRLYTSRLVLQKVPSEGS